MSGSVRLPPLGPLRAFHAVARHESITEATRELNVSASAVSQSIRKLEQWYGVPLLRREKGRLFLLPEGRLLHETCERVFAQLADTSRTIQGAADERTVSMSVLPSFVPLKLNAVLATIAASRPDVNIRLSSSAGLSDFRYDEIDIAIRYGAEPEGKYHETVLLAGDELQPCIGPGLLGTRDVDDLALLDDHRSIRDMSATLSSPDLWACWLARNELGDAGPHTGPNARSGTVRETVTDDYFHAVELAATNQGIVMGRLYLLEDRIAAGDLVPLFPSLATALSPASYYLLHRAEGYMTRQALDVRDMLLDALRRD